MNRPCPVLLAAFTALAVVASVTVAATPAAATSDAVPTAAWTGSIDVESKQVFLVAGEVGFTEEAKATYRNLARNDASFLQKLYTADLTFNHTETVVQSCPNSTTRVVTSITKGDESNEYFFATGSVEAFELYDTEEGTFFFPYPLIYTGINTSYCPGGTEGPGTGSALSYQQSNLIAPVSPLVDTDPDPDRLVGTTTYTLANVPGGALKNYSEYSYVVTYDLTRNANPDRDGDGVLNADDNCPDKHNPQQEDVDADGRGNVCDDSDFDGVTDNIDQCPGTLPGFPVNSVGCSGELLAVDDGLDDDFVTIVDGGLLLDVLANDIGDDIEIVDSSNFGHDEGAINHTASGLTWGFTAPPSGTYQFVYTIRDRYRQEDSALVTVQVLCGTDVESLDMNWIAGIDGPGRADADLYELNASVSYCPESGEITAFELTPSVKGSANSVLGFLGFDLQAGEVSYSPPRDTYPALTVSGSVRFDLCISPAALLSRFSGKQIEQAVTRPIERALNRNLRRSGEWTAASLRIGLQTGRDNLLRKVASEIRRAPGLRGDTGDVVVELVDGSLREVLNKAISEVQGAAGIGAIYGMTPDEAAVWATRELLSRIPSVCGPLRVWEPEVTLVGRPIIGPLQPSIPAGYTNPFLVIR